jgi:putative nucleotidyltransferase with HDIG domain
MAVPDLDRAWEILESYALPEGIVHHSEGVRRVATEAARLVAAADVPIDVRLVEVAALLHDIDKLQIRQSGGEHGIVGATDLEKMGYSELAMPVASHPLSCLLDDDRFPRGWPSVLLAIADRHVAQEFLTIDQRLDEMAGRYPEHRAGIEAARRPAHALERELADTLGLSTEALVERLRAAWEAA